MNQNHEKTGLAAFLLSLLAVPTLGLAVVPALICAFISKRQSDAAGEQTDGFTTAAVVLCGFILFAWAAIIFLAIWVMLAGGMKEALPGISMESIRAMLIGTAMGIIGVSCVMLAQGRSQRHDEKNKLRRLSGRGRRTAGPRLRRRHSAVAADHWD